MTMTWNYQRPKEKHKYRVYLCAHIYDCAGDINCEINHREFVGETWAVSAAQAETNVRYRNGDKFNFDADEHGEYWYEAEEV